MPAEEYTFTHSQKGIVFSWREYRSISVQEKISDGAILNEAQRTAYTGEQGNIFAHLPYGYSCFYKTPASKRRMAG